MSDNKLKLCSDCGSYFRTAWDLKKHINVVHTKANTELCPICGDTFLLRYKLKNHMTSRHRFKKDFKCEQCNGEFLSAPGLDSHTITCGDKGKHVCNKCSKHIQKRRDFKSRNDGHLGEKSHECETCEKKFVHKTSLTKYKYVHDKSSSFL